MFRKLDDYLLTKLDSVTTMLQKRGILLTTIRVAAIGTSTAGMIVGHRDSPGWMAAFGLLWGINTIATIYWARNNRDYPENVRKMRELNARSIEIRENGLFQRYLWLGLTFWETADLIFSTGSLFTIIGCATFGLCEFLGACTFLGPGEFAKERKAKLEALPSEV